METALNKAIANDCISQGFGGKVVPSCLVAGPGALADEICASGRIAYSDQDFRNAINQAFPMCGQTSCNGAVVTMPPVKGPCNFCRGYRLKFSGEYTGWAARDMLLDTVRDVNTIRWALGETEHCSWGQRTWATKELRIGYSHYPGNQAWSSPPLSTCAELVYKTLYITIYSILGALSPLRGRECAELLWRRCQADCGTPAASEARHTCLALVVVEGCHQHFLCGVVFVVLGTL